MSYLTLLNRLKISLDNAMYGERKLQGLTTEERCSIACRLAHALLDLGKFDIKLKAESE
jgi:uncharacterized protein YdiU (UPF0061 family)